MPARIPPSTRQRIYELRRNGFGHVAIASELNLARSTVARYADEADAEVELAATPAAGLTGAEIDKLRVLLDSSAVVGCPTCERPLAFVSSQVVARPDDRGEAQLCCPRCHAAVVVTVSVRAVAGRSATGGVRGQSSQKAKTRPRR